MSKRNQDWDEVPGCCESPWLRGRSWGGGSVWDSKLNDLGLTERREEPIWWWVEVYESGR